MSAYSYPRLKLQLHFDPEHWIGPGKADLLQAIRDTGSISAAGRQMGMSYKRAWMLVETLNVMFTEPLVTSMRGGKAGGHAQLTSAGHQVLGLYRDMQDRAQAAVADDLAALAAMQRP